MRLSRIACTDRKRCWAPCSCPFSNSAPDVVIRQGNNSGWLIGAFALGLVIWELLPMLAPRLSMRGWQPATVTVGLAIGLLLATLVKMITDNEFQLAWVWGLLGIALAILAIAIISLRHRWNHRGDAAASPTPLPTA